MTGQISMMMEWICNNMGFCTSILVLFGVLFLVLAEYIACRTFRYLPVAVILVIADIIAMRDVWPFR